MLSGDCESKDNSNNTIEPIKATIPTAEETIYKIFKSHFSGFTGLSYVIVCYRNNGTIIQDGNSDKAMTGIAKYDGQSALYSFG